ncbi:MAG: hypothetical protein A2138_27085 [Deltaproteobacteria bacterium RBG_16_71_12]|nr:MAG: hypothetical protein A2138_27085 [Deltaproteobacteria bacterium RBG_16_71_12]
MSLTHLDAQDLVEIYGAKNVMEADRLVSLLGDEDIEAIYRATTMSSFPTAVEAHYLVCVRADDRARAVELIEAARNDGAISTDGAFL